MERDEISLEEFAKRAAHVVQLARAYRRDTEIFWTMHAAKQTSGVLELARANDTLFAMVCELAKLTGPSAVTAELEKPDPRVVPRQ